MTAAVVTVLMEVARVVVEAGKKWWVVVEEEEGVEKAWHNLVRPRQSEERPSHEAVTAAQA